RAARRSPRRRRSPGSSVRGSGGWFATRGRMRSSPDDRQDVAPEQRPRRAKPGDDAERGGDDDGAKRNRAGHANEDERGVVARLEDRVHETLGCKREQDAEHGAERGDEDTFDRNRQQQ